MKNQLYNTTLTSNNSTATVGVSYMLSILEAVYNGSHDNPSIIEKLRKDYLDYCYEDSDYLLSSGTYSIDKKIRSYVFKLYHAGFLNKKCRGWYELSSLGHEVLKEVPWLLHGGLEVALDQKGICSGALCYQLRKHDDGTYGAAKHSLEVNNLIKIAMEKEENNDEATYL